MLKLCDENNRHNLTDDFRMYYSGSYVCKSGENNTLDVMCVMDVLRKANRDGTKIEHMLFTGEVSKAGNNSVMETWPGDDLVVFQPTTGYYRISDRTRYISFNVGNRTNKKGFQANTTLADGQGFRPNIRQVWQLFNRTRPDNTFGRDLWLSSGKIFWKGLDIGKFHDGVLELNKEYNHIQEYVCKVLGRFMAITVKEQQ